MIIVCKLKSVLLDIRKSQTELADYVGLTKANMSLIANGHAMPKIDTALMIARFCGKSVEDIWKIEN